MTSSISRPEVARSERPRADTTPAVTVDSKPSGLPIATTSWPRRSALESPSAAAGVPAGRSVRISARSVSGSSPSTRASRWLVGEGGARLAPPTVAVGQHQPVAGDYHAGTDSPATLSVTVR
jgi:hypothetical protein